MALVGDRGSLGWKTTTVNLGQVPLGSTLRVNISARVKNALDSSGESIGFLDNTRVSFL